MARSSLNYTDPTGQTLKSGAQAIDNMMIELYDHRAHNVLHDGAVGTSSYSTGGGADDSQEIQAVLTAAAVDATGRGLAHLPGNRTYGIASTVTMPQGVHLVGLGGRDGQGQSTPPTIVWTGAAGGLMFDCVYATENVFTTVFENLCIRGGDNIDKPGCAIRFRPNASEAAKLDSGTFIRNCWFQVINGNAIEINTNGATNFTIDGGRFDAIYGGYAIYAGLNSTGKSCNLTITGNTNWTAGNGVYGQGKGFIHMDGDNASAGSGLSNICIAGNLHTECNFDLTETFAAGANESDQQGVIRLGCTPGLSHVQHRFYANNIQHSFPAGIKSHSYFQLTATSGTDAAIAECAQITVMNGESLHQFNSSDAATTNEIRIIGGGVPTIERYPFLGFRNGVFIWGRGKTSSYEQIRHFVYADDFRVRGLAIHPETGTVAPKLICGTTSPGGAVTAPKGSLYIDTDASSTTTRIYINTDGGTTWANFTVST